MASFRPGGGGNGLPCPPPSAEERRLLELLERAPSARFTAILKCIPGWQFEGQANLRNWETVLEKLKSQLVTAIEQCPRLLVVAPPPPPVVAVNGKEDVTNTAMAKDVVMSDDDERQLTEQVYETLRFTAILLENASNKHLFNAIESVVALMGARDENVAFEATHVFATLALLPQQHRHAVDPMAVQVDSPASSNSTLRRRLLALAQGYGTAQGSSVDDFLAPLVEKQAAPSAEDVRRQLSDAALYQFYREPQTSASDELVVVKLNQSSLELLVNSSGSAALAGTICEQLIETWSVPVEDQFQLLVRIRSVVSAVRPTRSAESSTVERLHALLALFYLFGDSLDVATLVEQHPGLARGLTEIVRVENNDEVPLRARVTALHVLTALVYDRTERGGSGGILGRQSNVLQALGVAKGSPHGAFPSLVRFAMSELGQMAPRVRSSSASSTATASMAPAHDETDADPNDMDMSLAVAFVQATSDLITPEDAQVLRVGLFRDPLHPQESKLCWIEAVLVLLNQVVSMQSGAAVLTESGVIPALLHVASSPASSPYHISLITLCIQALETTINTHAAAAALYRELNGVGMIIDRLQTEIAASSVESVSETTTVLIIALLVMLSVSFHSQGVMSAGATSRVIRDGSPLSKALIKILSSIDLFGPVVFAQAAIVVSDIVNNDPSSVNQIHAGGIADAFLKTLTRWNVAELHAERILPPSSELIMAIPSVLSALCLTSAHAEKVARFKPLLYLLDCFVMPAYASEDCDHLHGDTAAIVGSGVFEMMRQVTGFQTAAIQACIEATKKLIRFGEECQLSATRATQKTEENYNTLLRMATHLNDVLEPILSKPEHASSFSDHGGVQYLLKLYRLILPTAPAFLSSLLTARSGNKAGRASLMTHQPAAQSITVALRSFASQQPPKMLSAIMVELSKQLGELQSQRGDVGGLISSLPDVELAELFNENTATREGVEETSERNTKLQGISQYLRQLAFIEWQVGLLTWTMQTAQASLQSRHWFSELLSRTNTATLEKLFAVSRGVQLERASLTAGHRSSTHVSSEKEAASLGGNKIKGLWKLCSLLLLRFSSVTRNLLVKMSTTFVSTPIQHRRVEDTVHPLAMHAHSLARLVASTLRADIEFVFSTTDGQACRVEDDFVKRYYLIFVLETVMQTIFDSKKKQANALVLHKLARSEIPVGSTSPSSYSCLHTMVGYLTNDCFTASPSEGENTASARMREMCVRAGSSALQHLGDLETLRTSQLTVSLAGDDAASATMDENDRFDLRKLSIQLHRECLDLVLRMWQHPDVRVAPVQKYAQELLPAVVMILRHRLDLVDASEEAAASGLDPLQQRLRDRSRRRELGNPFGDFPGASGSLLDRDDLIQALFGGIGQPGRAGRPAGASRPFEVDSATVDSLVAMGFPRRRVERAIRRVRLNDVEVVMEWLLSHPDAEGEDDDNDDEEAEQAGDANGESAETGPESSAAGAQEDDPMAASSTENRQSEDEKALYEGYTTLRAGFEDVCFGILRHQASVPVATAPSSVDASKDLATYELQSFVMTLAQYFALLSSKVDDERQKVTGRVSDALLRAMSHGETEPDRYVMMLAHLLAVMLQLDAGSVDTLTKQDASCLDAIVAFIRTGVSVEKKMRQSYAPLLLVVDAVQASDAAPTDRPLGAITGEAETSSTPKLSVTMRCELVRLSVELMKSSELTRNTAHALWQLLGRITLDYEVASELLTSPGALEQLFSLRESAMFPGYKEMTAALLVQLLESPQVLEQMMEDKIQQAMTKLAERYGPPSQMRITPRVLIMEVAPFAARSEKIFMQALQKTLSFKKTESGRVYVVPKETVAPFSGAEASVTTGDAATATATAPQDDLHHGDKEKKALHKLPKSHRHHAQTIVNMLTDRIQSAWQTEKALPETRKLEDDEESTCDTTGVCAGTYLYLLTQVVSTFPACAAVITKHHDATHPSGGIIHLILRELLPCKALCRFATIRRVSLGDETATLGATGRARNALTFRTRERLRNAHKLLVAVGTQPGDGPKVIVGELVRLFQTWPASVTSSLTPTEDLSVDDEEALSALHAWSALIMSILWPKGTASKSLSWDKVVLGGGLKGKYAFVTLLVEALRKISLSHPFAYSTCAMLLRPLTTLTRPFVTHRVKKLLKKRSVSTGAERDEEVAESTEATASTSHPLTGSSTLADHDVPLAEPLEPVRSDVDDVAMNSPPDSAADHEMRDAAGDSDDESDRSSMSGRSSVAGADRRHRHHDEDRDHGEDEEEDEEEEDDDEDEGEEDEDDDDDDDDDDEEDDDEDEEMEEEEGRIRLRMSRRHQEGNTRGRGVGGRAWGALDTEGAGADGFDEVDEDEFSYLRLLDDESFVSSQARAALVRQTARTRAATPGASSGSPLLRSLVDMFSLDGGGGGASGSQVGVFAFGDDDEDEDDPDMAFRHREQGLPQPSTSSSPSDVANMGTALANLLEDRADVSDDNDFIFETVDLGAANSRQGAAARGAVGVESLPISAGMLHPLLRSSGSASQDASVDRERRAGGLGGLLPDRLPLPRHAPSLFRELNVLVRQMNSNLNFAPGAGTMLGRDLLRHAGGGRNRPPSRNRLSAVSNLLSEFSLDIPTAGLFGHGRQHRGAGASLLRGDRDLLGARGGLRGDWGFDSLSAQLGGGPIAATTDARTMAARLEQMANQLVEADAPTPSVPTSAPSSDPVDSAGRPSDSTGVEASSEAVSTTGESGREGQTISGDGVSEQTQANEAASDTASVIALASSLSLQSPAQDDTGSETEIPTSPQLSSSSTTGATSSVVSASDSAPILPPPAPVAASTSGDLLNFTLDLTSFQAPMPPQPSAEVATSAENVVEEEMKTEEEEMTEQPSGDADIGLVCPEGVDPEVFAFLPPDMQAEIIAQHAPPAAQPQTQTQAASSGASGTEGMSQLEMDMANSSFDRETLEALPEDIRAEVLANERREREAAARSAEVPADVSRAEEMDNASFIASLAPGLREEILTTCDDAFLQTLSTQVQAEAMVLRERAAYRPAFHEAARATTGRGAPADDDTTGDIFRRPTLRRMLTSHGPDIFSAAGRRPGRGRHGGDGSSTRGRGGRDDASGTSHAGMVRVLHDEEEAVGDRILEDGSVKALLRLLFLNKSIVHTRVFQRLLTNVCLYPLTRGCVRVYLMRILSSPLAAPLVLKDASEGGDDDEFPPKELYGTSTGLACGWTSVLTRQSVSPEVLSRVLTVLVTLAKQNMRFAVDILRHHGMHRKGLLPTGESHHESGVEVLIELLEVPVVSRSATHLETLLELLELILLPLSRIARKESDDEEKKENDEDAKPLPTDSADWVHVPHVSMDARRLGNLVSVLTLSICSPTMQERTIQILKLLDRVAANRPLIMNALVHEAKRLATSDRFRSCSGNGNSVFESSAVLKSAQDELTLLRLLHTLSDVCETTSDFNECCSTIGLDALWEALSKSLDEARLLSGGAIDAPVVAAASTPRVVDSASAADTQAGEDNEGMVIEGKSAGASIAMAALLARFLPMVEAFFVVSARDAATMPLRVPDSAEREEAFVTALRESGLESAESLQHGRLELKRLASVTTSDAGSDGIRLAAFVEANRVLLNLLVREKPSLLDSSLAALIKLPRCRAYLDFDNKRTYFQSAMKKLRHTALRSQVGNAAVRLAVRRDHIFEDSYYALRMRSGAELRRKLHISFTGEEGIDAGGVTREWYVILAREIFNPNYVLFTSAADSPTFQPNPLSYVNKDHLSYFEFVGKVIGKAVADGQLLDAHFTRSFYKHILQLPISYHDMEAIDPEYYRNLHSILDNAIEDLGLELTFSAEQSNFGRMEIVDLIPNGRNIAVTDGNKMEYVKLVTHHRMATGIRQQIDAFLKGFHQLVPPEMISIFNENELELLISGMPEIDIDDLKANTDYANYKPTDAVIRWFWNVLYSCTHEERALFLQFVTGTSKVPLEGFKALEGMRGTHKFNIHKAFGNPNALPSAHTCFNQLDLPEYESEEKLRQCLLLAIREGSEGFGFG